MDVDLIEQVLSSKELVTEQDIITDSFLEKFSHYGLDKVCALFKSHVEYRCEFKCKECGMLIKKTMTKFAIFQGDNKYIKFRCYNCMEKEKKKDEAIRNERHVTYEENINEKTDKFIKAFLEDGINPELKINDKIDFVFHNTYDNKAIANKINSMKYSEFILTQYWKTVSFYMKKKNYFSCELCSAKENLRTHHKSYEHHGYEHIKYKEMLIVLCDKCHAKFHDKIKEGE